jgi:hypothetical protein
MRALFLQRPNRQVLLAAFGSIYPVASDRYRYALPVNWCCTAQTTASVRECTPILSLVFRRWKRTVRSEMLSSSAMQLFVLPFANKRSTANSRPVSLGNPDCPLCTHAAIRLAIAGLNHPFPSATARTAAHPGRSVFQVPSPVILNMFPSTPLIQFGGL